MILTHDVRWHGCDGANTENYPFFKTLMKTQDRKQPLDRIK